MHGIKKTPRREAQVIDPTSSHLIAVNLVNQRVSWLDPLVNAKYVFEYKKDTKAS